MHVSSLPLHILCVDSLAQLDVDGEILTSAKEIANASVVRSSNLISGKSPEESPPKFRRKLPVPMPKWAGQVSPCNDVSQSFGEADVKVMPPAAEPWDKLRGDQFDVMENEVVQTCTKFFFVYMLVIRITCKTLRSHQKHSTNK